MPSIADIVRQLVAAPKPIICLDACDILELVQCLDWEKGGTARSSACTTAARHVLTTLAADPDKALVVITQLVAIEWDQNIAGIRDNASRFLSQVDSLVRRSYEAADAARTPLLPFGELSASAMVDDLVTLSKALLNQATQIDLQATQIDLAVQRVMSKRRPSHDGHLKDSIHFEHYLELARQLRAAGVGEECVFVSRNKRDFWDGTHSSIHPELKSEIEDESVRIRFFGSIEAASGYLHI